MVGEFSQGFKCNNKANLARNVLLKFTDKEIRKEAVQLFQKNSSLLQTDEFKVEFKEHLFFSKEDENQMEEATHPKSQIIEAKKGALSEKEEKKEKFLHSLTPKTLKIKEKEREAFNFLLSYKSSLKQKVALPPKEKMIYLMF